MSIAVSQKPNGREFNESSASIGFVARCDAGESDEEVRAQVEAEAPAQYMGLARTNVFAQETAGDADGNPTVWDVRVDYGKRGGRLQVPKTGDIIWTGSTSGGTQHITQSRSASLYEAEGLLDPPPVETWGTIGDTNEGVAGVDVVIPVFAFRAVKYVPGRQFPALLNQFTLMTGSVNDDAWTVNGMEFEAGEVLFLGATWAARTDQDPPDYEVSFEFAASPNVEDVEIGTITVAEKKGWDYLDIRYRETESDGIVVRRPILIKVHTLYRGSNFSLLELED
jgi:hypothetical protein